MFYPCDQIRHKFKGRKQMMCQCINSEFWSKLILEQWWYNLIIVCMIASNTWKICMTYIQISHIITFCFSFIFMYICILKVHLTLMAYGYRFGMFPTESLIVWCRIRTLSQCSAHPITVIVVVTWLQFSKLERIWIKTSSNSIQHLGKSSQTWLARPQTTFCNCPVQSC
jgi:hypothetical protein